MLVYLAWLSDTFILQIGSKATEIYSIFTTQNSITHLTYDVSKETRPSLPPPKKPKPKTVPKSFRVDESALIAVEKEATAQQVSSNTLINQILIQFSEFERFAKKINTVKPSSFVFRGLLEAADADKIIELAKSAAAVFLKHSSQQEAKELTSTHF